ncbi:MAG TPA: Ig-like domain-containing protein, partial [Gemmatimonadales bacterium]
MGPTPPMRLLLLVASLLLHAPAAAQVARVEVQPDRATLIAGNQLALRVVARDAAGREIVVRRIRWEASSADAVVVDSAGVVTGFREGVARVTATVDGVAGVAELVIEPKSAARIDVVAEQPDIVVGGNTLLRAVARTDDGTPLPRAVFTFRSSDDRVATVDPSGVVTGRGEGSAIF